MAKYGAYGYGRAFLEANEKALAAMKKRMSPRAWKLAKAMAKEARDGD